MLTTIRNRRVARAVQRALRAQLHGDLQAFDYLEPLFSPPFTVEDVEVANATLVAVIAREMPRGITPALRFGHTDDVTGEYTVVEPEAAPGPLVAWGRLLAAVLTDDPPMMGGVWAGYVGNDPARARELLRFSLESAGRYIASIPCTCGQCPTATPDGDR